ncbi:hypothetical protein FQA39_LY02240 [Lamprigera yunnana]|nr:hypothetical protein FQA39_LY02240 [Lamprigera yunnana]
MLYRMIMNNNSEVYKLKDLEKLAPEALFDFINGISEEQALNSDIEGDSDAEDNLVYDTPININEPSTSYSTRSSVWNNSENREISDKDYDSDVQLLIQTITQTKTATG